MLPFKIVYHDGYDLGLGGHVFPSLKYRLIRRRLLDEFVAGPEDFVTPEPAPRDALLRVHSEEWIHKLQTGTLTYEEVRKLEIPYSRTAVQATLLAAGGTLEAGRLAVRDGCAVNLGGGFHHAFPGHGEGFCAINDVAVGIRGLQTAGQIRRALVADCDAHQGNGTAAVFRGDPQVFTLSIHQLNNYPTDKPPSTIDVNLEDGVGDREYLGELEPAYTSLLDTLTPDIVFYVAGSDPYCEDMLCQLALTKEGMYARDRLIFEEAFRRRIPVVVTMAGGYARRVEDTVELHANTVVAAREALRMAGTRFAPR